MTAYTGGPDFNSSIADLAAIFSQFQFVLEQRVRHIAREEHTQLLAEMAADAVCMDRSEDNLTVNQTADILGIRPQTVYEWIQVGKLKAHRMGKGNRTLRLKRGDVDAALQAQIQPCGRRKYARRVNVSLMRKDTKAGAAVC
ncbi:helix-turn-helix domain-containing protein [Hymenobacter terrigena]